MKYTIKQFNKEFPDDDTCLESLFQNRYANIDHCPQCAVIKPRFHKVTNRKCYACQDCGYQLHPLAGTIFHKSSTHLTLWFYAMYLFSVSRNGVSAKELERQLGVTYKTAWRMANHIRQLMEQGNSLLSGTVEADEAYIGGRKRLSTWHQEKTPLLGVVERRGRVRTKVVMRPYRYGVSEGDVTDFVTSNVLTESVLQTDGSPLYRASAKMYDRHIVNHGRYEFVRGDDYTNTIEGFWGLLKPSLLGTHRSVSRKHLQSYVNEFAWRYNHRNEQLYPLLLEAAGKPVLTVQGSDHADSYNAL